MLITQEQLDELQYLAALSDEALWGVIQSHETTPKELASHLAEASYRDPTARLETAPEPGSKEPLAEYLVLELERSPRGPAYTSVFTHQLESIQLWDSVLRSRAERVLFIIANTYLLELIALNLRGGTHENYSDTYHCLASCLRRWSSMCPPSEILKTLTFLSPAVPRGVHIVVLSCIGRAYHPGVNPGYGWNPGLDTKDLTVRVREIYRQALGDEDRVLTYYAFESLACLRDPDLAQHWEVLDPILRDSFYYSRKLKDLLSSLGVNFGSELKPCTSIQALKTQS